MAQKTSIDILIGAQDKASAKLDEVSNQLKALASQSAKTAKETAAAGKGGEEMAGGMGALLGTATKLVPVLAAVGAGFLAFKSLKGILIGGAEAFVVQEKAVRDLSVTLEALGDATEDLMPELQAYAGELQLLTNVGDEVTLGTMKRLRTLGFEAEELKGATQATIGLTAAFGSQEAAAEAVAKAHEGDFDALKEKIPALREATTLAEKQAAVNEAAAAGFLVASEGTETMGGALTALNNAWGDTLESVGQLLAPYITRIADMFNRIAPIIQEKIGLLLPIMENIAQRAAEISFWLFKQLVKGYTMIETVIVNFGDVVSGVWNTIQLAAHVYVNNFIHMFTQVIPAVASWFAENFSSIMTDLFNLMKTLLINYVKFYVDNFMFLINWVKSGFAGGMGAVMEQVGKNMGTNLVEGFVATTKPLPDVFARELTDAEKGLISDIAVSGAKVGNAYNEAVESRLGFFDELFSADLGAGAKAFEGIGLTEGARKREQEKLDKEKGKGEKAKLQAEETRFLTRGTGKQSPEEQMVEQQKESTNLIGKVADGIGTAVGLLGEILNKETAGDAIEIIQSNKGG